MFFRYSISTHPQKNSKEDGERKYLHLKSILDQVFAVHDKGTIDDLNLIKTEININNVNVAIDWKK